ncbi:hypothetical protein RHOSPDRAFT_34201 [Rhodotorula sp. JG-1b]|nr:hypothetical protein RHOSPDRAFT_34201 [Rhodotorula sp. JG-1b]
MSEQQQPRSDDREPTVSEISAAGAPNYRGRALHPQVQIDDKGLMYIGPIPPNKQDKRTVSVPVTVVAFGEQGQEQYAVRASDDNDRLELVVSSGPDLLRIDRCSPTSGGARTPWLAVPAKNLLYVKVTVNRWQDGKEGSDVLIAAAFKAEDRRQSTVPLLVLLIEVDTRHRDSSVLPPDNETPRRLDTPFDPNALEHIKAFFLSWQQKDYCCTEIDPTRALAVPPLLGQSLSSRPPIPEGYDPHDSTTWVAPFGPVSGDQEALYSDDAARKKGAAAATTAKAAGKGKARVKDKDAVVAAQVEAGPGPRPEANTNTNASATASSTAAAQQIVAGPPPDEEPTVVITQSGRTVRSGRRVHFPSAIDRESVEDDEDDAARKETAAVATVIATTTTTARGNAKAKVGVTMPAVAGAGDGPEASSSAKPSNGASSLPSSSSSSSVQKSVTPQATPAPPPAPPPPPAAAPVMITQSGRTVRSLRNVHFTSSIRTESENDDDNDDAEREEAPERAAAAAATMSKRKYEPNPKVGVTAPAAAAGAGVGPEASSSARRNGASSSSAQKTVTLEETPEAASVVITQSGRTVRSLRNVHFSYSSNTEGDDDAARKYPAAASKPKPRTRPKVAAAASLRGSQSVGPAAADAPPVPPAAAAEAPVVITQSGRTVKTRLVHFLPSDSEDDDTDADADAAADDDGAVVADDFSPPPPRRGSSSKKKKKKKKKKKPAKRLRVGRKESEPVVAVAAGDGDGGGGAQEGRGCRIEKGERAQKADVDREEEQVMQDDLAGAATMDGGFAKDRQEPQREVVAAQEAVPWPTMDRLPFALPPLPLSIATATGAAEYRQQQQQQVDATSLFGRDTTTTMTMRFSSRRSGGAPNAVSGASTVLR